MILGTYGRRIGMLPDVIIGRVTTSAMESADRKDQVLVCGAEAARTASGYAAILCDSPLSEPVLIPAVHSVRTDHLSDGDVVGIDQRGYVRTLYRRNSRHNSIFATDRCNSLCLMCSQPPKDVDETGIVDRHLKLVRLIDPATTELGISGGEPTLLGAGLIRVIEECRDRLPDTALHLLSNGRAFADYKFSQTLASVQHPDVMIGIPLYSDIDVEHDYVVQSRGAFAETMRGLHNLAQCGVAVEIRVVIHRATYQRLPQLAEFIYRNVTFAAQIALMGLEITGLTIPNLATLWIDPCDYRTELREATLFLASRGMPVAIYNHQLCTLPRELWRFSCRSISDWKNEYLAECSNCVVRNQCGGFFASALQRRQTSRHITPVTHS